MAAKRKRAARSGKNNPPAWQILLDAIGDGRLDWHDYPPAVKSKSHKQFAAAIAEYPDKSSLIMAMMDHIDSTIPRGINDGSLRDRLFDFYMGYIDAMAPYRRAIIIMLGDPSGGIPMARWVMRAAPEWARHIGAPEAIPACLLIPAMVGIFGFTIWTWMGDESPDMAKTMANLDRALQKVEWVLEKMPPSAKARKSAKA